MVDGVGDLRVTLRRHGYPPVPCEGKAPHLADWAQACLTANEREIRAWGRARPQESNTGIVTGAIVGVDIDVLDEGLADAVQELAGRILGMTPLVRFGRAPKRLLVYRTDSPFRKCATAELFLPGAPDFSRVHKHHVEVLGQGQQFIAYGIHPDTGQPYRWVEDGPRDIEAAALPVIEDREQAEAFVAAAERLLRGAGCLTEREIKGREADGRQSAGLETGQPADYDLIASCLRAIPNDGPYDEWARMGLAIYGALGPNGRPLWEEWSARSPKNDPAFTARKWSSFATVTSIGAGTIIWLAKSHGWQPPGGFRPDVSREARRSRPNGAGNGAWHEDEQPQAKPQSEPGAPSYDPPNLLDLVALSGVVPAPCEFLVDQMIPMEGNVTLLMGDGGIGKTLLAMQLQVDCALGTNWLGIDTTQCNSYGAYCEDNERELHRRLYDIMRYNGRCLADIAGIAHFDCRVDLDSIFMSVDGPAAAQTRLSGYYSRVMAECIERRCRLLVLDSQYNFYDGPEIVRSLALKFVRSLRRIATRMDGAVILCAHPSIMGMNTGTGASGTTGWHNAVRARLYFTGLEAAEGEKKEEDEDDGRRVLKWRKGQYSRKFPDIGLVWRDGLFIRDDAETLNPSLEIMARRRAEDAAFLACVDKASESAIQLSPTKKAGDAYAPKRAALMKESGAFKAGALERAMLRLYKAGKISEGTVRIRGKDRDTFIRVPVAGDIHQ
jgi:RecA-family ATPase